MLIPDMDVYRLIHMYDIFIEKEDHASLWTLECGVNWAWLSHNLCDTIESGLNFTRVDHF